MEIVYWQGVDDETHEGLRPGILCEHGSNDRKRFSQIVEDSVAVAIKYHNLLGKTYLCGQYYNKYHCIANN